MAIRAVFLDKDGTLIENLPHNVDPKRVRLARGALHAVWQLSRNGFLIIVVSDQPGIALGFFSRVDLQPVERHLRALLPLSGLYFCPHAPGGGCACRKPASGMLVEAAREHGVDLCESWMVGDILDDMEAGRRAGCRTVLVDSGNETEWRMSEERRPHARVACLPEAAELICHADCRGPP